MTPEAHIKYTAFVAGMVMQATQKAINVLHSLHVRGHALLLCVVVISHVPLIDLHMPDLLIKGRNFQKYSDQLTLLMTFFSSCLMQSRFILVYS